MSDYEFSDYEEDSAEVVDDVVDDIDILDNNLLDQIVDDNVSEEEEDDSGSELEAESISEQVSDYEDEIDDELTLEIEDGSLGTEQIVQKTIDLGSDRKKKSLNILSKYERTKLLGIRARLIEQGADIYTSITGLKNISPLDIARKELKERVIPLKIQRKLPNGLIELWDVEKLIFFNTS